MRESEEMDQERRVEQPQPANEAPGVPPHAPPLSGRVALLLIVVLLLVAVVIVVMLVRHVMMLHHTVMAMHLHATVRGCIFREC